MVEPTSLQEIMSQLPPEFQEDVRNYAQFLLDTKVKSKHDHIGLSWAGGLREHRKDYTSMALQAKALEWWD
jgi:hypothetical protein